MASSDEQRQHQHQPGNGNSREGSFSPLMQSIQQQPSQQHEDYDWMGVLDTLDDHFDLVDHDRVVYQQYHHHDNGDNAAAGAGAEYAAALPTAASVDSANVVVVGAGVQHQNIQNHGHDQECWQSTSSTGVGSGGGNNDNSAAALMLAAAAAARECSAGVGSISMSVQEAAVDADAEFTALAELVKEIEATDLAEEALFDFNKRYDNHGQEGEEEQQQHQHQNQVDEGVGPNNSNDGHDASVTVSSVASGEKHSKKFKSGDLDNNNSISNSNNNNNCPSSSSLLPMPNGAKSSTLLSSTSSSSSATSNRIDLIARTIVQLNHFRMLRRRRNNELRECQRKNCELRKECEGLHRLVAQYKAMGKMEGGGYNRPQLQEKVMMMVPMMVPQDAVTQIATGYPASHQYQAAAAACATPFLPTTMTMMNNSSSQHHHYPHFTNMTTPHPWMGGGVNMSSSASHHPHHTSTTSGGTGHQHHPQNCIHNMPSTFMPPSSQPHQYNYPAVGPSNFQPSGELHSMNTSTTASEATYNLAANNDSSQTQPHGMPNHATGGGEMNAPQGNIQVGQTPAPPNATGSTTPTTAIGLRHHPPPPHT
ncbi:hypothetical protein ACHAWU_009203, partial [Discostella pseudostelligera]